MAKILFIANDTTRSGAPMVLLNMLKWIKINTQIQFDVFAIEGGALLNEFESITNVYKPSYSKTSFTNRVLNKLLRKRSQYNANDLYAKIFNQLQIEKYDVIYGNTIVSISVFELLYKYFPNAKYFLHVHELYSLTHLYSETIERLKNKHIIFVSVSKLVSENLKQNHNLPATSIQLVHAFIDIDSIKNSIHSKTFEVESKYVINGSGYVQPRKGYEFFIFIAKRAVQKYPEIPFEFRWLGTVSEYIQPYIDIDIELGELSENLKFLGEVINPYPHFAQAQIFLLTSREDPFPLVCLEHASLGVPVMCFDKATGMTEFVLNDAGVIIPYLDIESVVDNLANLYHDTKKRQLMGKIAQERVKQYDINVQVPKILDLITNA